MFECPLRMKVLPELTSYADRAGEEDDDDDNNINNNNNNNNNQQQGCAELTQAQCECDVLGVWRVDRPSVAAEEDHPRQQVFGGGEEVAKPPPLEYKVSGGDTASELSSYRALLPTLWISE